MNGRTRNHSSQQQAGKVVTMLLVLVFLSLLGGLLYLVRGPILRFAGESWVVEDSLEPSDAIIVLSDDNFYADRAQHAAELFRHGLAPVVVASGRRLRPYAGIGELMVHDLSERGVPKEKIEVFAQSGDNTKDEAEALVPLIAKKKWRSVIVVTSNYHTRRARYIWRRVVPSTVRVEIASAPDGEFDPQNWWWHRKSLKELTREVVGLLVAMWELHGTTPMHGQIQVMVERDALNPLPIV